MWYNVFMSSKEYQAAWHQANKERRLVSIREAKQLRKAGTKAWLHELKSAPCTDCDVSYPYYVMEWDHVRGVKLFNIADWFRNDVSRSKIEAELSKCELVCANCHAERSHQRRATIV